MECINCGAEVMVTRSAFDTRTEYIVDMPEQLSKLHQSLLAKGMKPIFNCAIYKIHKCNTEKQTEMPLETKKKKKTTNDNPTLF